jgi:hypothetical protein
MLEKDEQKKINKINSNLWNKSQDQIKTNRNISNFYPN